MRHGCGKTKHNEESHRRAPRPPYLRSSPPALRAGTRLLWRYSSLCFVLPTQVRTVQLKHIFLKLVLLIGVTFFLTVPVLAQEVSDTTDTEAARERFGAPGDDGKLPGAIRPEHSRAQEILTDQLQILKKQGFLGKGRPVKRRLEKLRDHARRAHKEQLYEDAALFYFGILENPEFKGLINEEELELALVENLYLAEQDYVALDYIYRIFDRGPDGRYFKQSFFILVDIFNRLNDWQAIALVMNKLNRFFGQMPQEVEHEAAYLFGRWALFADRLDEAEEAFNRIPKQNRFYLRGRYHLGVVETVRKDFAKAFVYFQEVYNQTKGKPKRGRKSIERFLLNAQAALSLARVQYALGKEANFQLVSEDSPLYGTSLFDRGWGHFGVKRYGQALTTADKFIAIYPEHPLIPEAYLLQAHTHLELGELEKAQELFMSFVWRYEDMGKNLKRFADKKFKGDAFEQLLKELDHLTIKSEKPELLARVFNDYRLQQVKSFIDDIADGRASLSSRKGSWESLRSAILRGEDKIFFPSTTRIKPFGGRDRKSGYRSRPGSQFNEIEILEKEIKSRIQSLEAQYEGFTPEQGRKKALENAIKEEVDRLKKLQARIDTVRSRVQTLEKDLPASMQLEIEQNEAKEKERLEEFASIIGREIELIPELQSELDLKSASLDRLTLDFVLLRIRQVGQDVDELIERAFLGELEVAFVRYENSKEKTLAEQKKLIGKLNSFIARYPNSIAIPKQLMRLAEIKYQRKRDAYFAEQERFDDLYEDYLQGKRKKEPLEPTPNYAESVTICRNILRDYPKHKDIDQVLYLLGFYLEEQGQANEAIKAFEQLVADYPKSPFLTESYMRLAEFYFTNGAFLRAIQTYKKILQYPDSLFYEMALYKIAWSHFKLGQFADSSENFLRLITFTDERIEQAEKTPEGQEAKERLSDLREEAITYLALSFSESAGASEVISRFKKLGMSQYTLKVLRRMSDVYFEQLRYNQAIGASRVLLKADPYAELAPNYQERIIVSLEQIGAREAAFKERQKLASMFGAGSTWAEKNKGNEKVIAAANQLIDESLLYNATYFHEQGQKRGDQKDYTKAVTSYQDYLARYPKSKKAYEIRFLYAEALFDLKQYRDAAFHYRRVVEAKPLSDSEAVYFKDSAFNVVLSWEKIMAAKGSRFQQKAYDMAKIVIPRFGDEKALRALRVKARPLTPEEKSLYKAYEDYGTWLPNGKKAAEVFYKSGLLVYQTGQYNNATKRFEAFIEKYPKNGFVSPAANFVLSAHIATGNWDQVENWTRKILKKKSLRRDFKPETLKRLLAATLLYKAQKTQEGGDLAKASEQYLEIEKEIGDANLGPTAIFNAAANYDKLGDQAKAVASLIQLTQRYPKSKFVPESLFKIAKYYEKEGQYAEALSRYETLAYQHAKTKYGKDSLINAAVFAQKLRRYQKASQHYLKYIERYPREADVPEVYLLATQAKEYAGLRAEAARMYTQHATRYAKNANAQAESFGQAGELYERLGNRKQAQSQYEAALRVYRRNPASVKASGRFFAAKARFAQGEAAFRQFTSVKLRLPPKRMAQLLEQKAQRLDRANKIFLDVASIGDSYYAVAALYHVGKGYQIFSETLFSAPKPKGLDQEALDIYQTQLEDQAIPLEDKAIEAFEKALAKSYELGSYGKWSEKIYETLGQFRPKKYPPIQERLPRIRSKIGSDRTQFVTVEPAR